jgi:hypothetical protein
LSFRALFLIRELSSDQPLWIITGKKTDDWHDHIFWSSNDESSQKKSWCIHTSYFTSCKEIITS